MNRFHFEIAAVKAIEGGHLHFATALSKLAREAPPFAKHSQVVQPIIPPPSDITTFAFDMMKSYAEELKREGQL